MMYFSTHPRFYGNLTHTLLQLKDCSPCTHSERERRNSLLNSELLQFQRSTMVQSWKLQNEMVMLSVYLIKHHTMKYGEMEVRLRAFSTPALDSCERPNIRTGLFKPGTPTDVPSDPVWTWWRREKMFMSEIESRSSSRNSLCCLGSHINTCVSK
jgi:hypothetical protein